MSAGIEILKGISAPLLQVAGTVISSDAARSEAHELREQVAPSNALNLQLLRTRARVAEQLDDIATKLERGDPVSPQEQQFLDSTFQQATADISQIREQAVQEQIGTQAGLGFARSGRLAGQTRRTNIAAGSATQQAVLAREGAALERGFERTVRIPTSIRQGLLTGAQSAPITAVQIPSSGSFTGSALTSFASGLQGRTDQQAAAKSKLDNLQALLASFRDPNAANVQTRAGGGLPPITAPKFGGF